MRDLRHELRAQDTSSFAPVGRALLSDLLPATDRVRWFSHQYLFVNVGYAVGPLIGIVLGLSGGRTAFLVAAIAYAGYLTLLAFSIRTAPPTPRSPARPGVVTHFRDSVRVVVRWIR